MLDAGAKVVLVKRALRSPEPTLMTRLPAPWVACLFATALPLFAEVPPSSFSRTITHGGESLVVDYASHPVRGPAFEVLVQDASGALVPHAAAGSRIYLGTVPGRPGAMAAGLLKEDGRLITRINFESGVEWIDDGGSVSQRGNTSWSPNWPEELPGSGGAGPNVYAAEVAVDAPHDLYLAAGGTVDDTVEICEFSLMATNLPYLRDAAIVHQLGRVIVRSAPSQDPYEAIGGDAGGLLNGVRDQWNNVLPASGHDLGLVARRGVGGGVAWVNAVGTGNRYSANGCSPIGEFTVVWRHEAGHNWGLGHYDGGAPEGPTINSGNTLGRISSPELVRMLAHRDSRISLGILDLVGPYPHPLPPRASADRAGFQPGSGPVTLDVLDNDSDSNGDTLAIVGFDTVTPLGGTVTLSAGTGPGGRDELAYTPAPGFLEGLDHFTYRIADATGREAVGHAMVRPEYSGELLAHWNFDENGGATAADSTPSARHATIAGTPGWTAAGRENAALSVNGSDNPATAPPLGVETNALTFTAWVRRNGDQADWAGIAFNRGGGATGLNFGTANELRYHWDGGGHSSYNFNSGLVPPDGVWTFVALVIEPSRATIHMRPAGGALQSAVSTGSFAVRNLSGDFWIGRDPNSSSRTFRGDIDEVRVDARSLDATEIASLSAGGGNASGPSPALGGAVLLPGGQDLSWTSPPGITGHAVYLGTDYAAVAGADPSSDEFLGNTDVTHWTPPALAEGSYFWRVDTTDGSTTFPGPVWFFTASPQLVDGLVGWWKLDDGDGPIALDASPSGAHGTLDLPAWTTGRRLGALDFDGDDRVECGGNASLSGITPFTLAAWIRVPVGQATTGVIVQQRDQGGFNGQYRLRVNADGTVGFWVYGNSSTQFDLRSATTVNDGQWHHVAALRDASGGARVLIDGVEAASITGTTVRSLSASIGVGIGADIRDDVAHFVGTIDDVRIYDRALDAAERAEVRNRAPYFIDTAGITVGATAGTPQPGSVAGRALDPDPGEILSFSLTDGPAWFDLAPDGSYAASPGLFDAGSHEVTVRVTDAGGRPDEATLAVNVTLTPHQQWLVDTFGPDAGDPSIAGDEADPDQDQLSNLEEWSYGTDALTPSVAPIVARHAEEGEEPGFRIVIDRNPDAGDIDFRVEGSPDLSPGSWATTGLAIEEDTPARLVVRDLVGGPHRFLRLALTRRP